MYNPKVGLENALVFFHEIICYIIKGCEEIQMKSNKNIKRQMQDTLLIKRKVKYDQEMYRLFFNKIFPNHAEFLNFLHTSGKDSMVKHAKNIVDRLLFDTPWSGAENLYRNLLSFETKILTSENGTYIPQNHTVHSVHLYMLGIYFYFNFSVFHDALSKYFRNISKPVSEQLCGNYTKDQQAFLSFLDAWKCFALLHDVAYPYEALIDNEGNMEEKNTRFLDPYQNMNAYMQYSCSMKFFAHMLLINLIIRDSTKKLEDYICTDMSKFVYLKDKKKDKKRECTLGNLNNFYKLEYIYNFSDFEMFTSWIKVKNKVIVLRDRKGIEKIIIMWSRPDVWDIFVNSEHIGKKISAQKIEKILHNSEPEGNLFAEFYAQEDLEHLYEKKLSDLNLRARKKDFDELCTAVRKDISIELASMPKYWNLQDIVFLIVQYLGKWCAVDKILEEGSFNLSPDEFLAENVDLFKQAIRHNVKKTMLDTIEQGGTFFHRSDMEKVLKKISCLDMNDLSEKIEQEYYSRKQETEQLGLYCVEVFRIIFNDLWGQQIEKEKKIYAKDMKMDDIIIFRKDSREDFSVGNQLECLLEKENFSKKEDSEPFERLFKYTTEYYRFDHGIMAGRLIYEALNYVSECMQKWKDKNINVLREYKNMSLEGITEAIYSIFVHNIYVREYQKTCGILPNHDLLINPFTYFGMFCDNLQVWDRDKSINQGDMEWRGNTLYGEDISINLKEKTIEIKCRASDIRTSFFKLKEGMGEYLNSADKLIELNLFE